MKHKVLERERLWGWIRALVKTLLAPTQAASAEVRGWGCREDPEGVTVWVQCRGTHTSGCACGPTGVFLTIMEVCGVLHSSGSDM